MMTNFIQLSIILYLLTNLFAGNRREEKWTIEGHAQGTTYRILYYASDSIVKHSDIDQIFSSLDSSISIYKSYSLINKFNDSEKGLYIDEHMRKLVVKSLEVFSESAGAFDLTVKPLVAAWGFGTEEKQTLPDSAEINRLKKEIGMKNLKLRGNYLSKTSPKINIDINGIGQGYSVDLLAGFLEQQGIKRYLVEVGGELRSRGGKPEDGVFKVGIERPDAEGNPIAKVVNITNGAITTSGTYRRYLLSNGRRLSHIIDPSTGYPVDNNLLSVTVFADNATTADGYDNVFMVWGLKKSLDMLSKQDKLGAYFIYKDKSGSIKDTVGGNFPAFSNN